jgi:hypothetical protein
LIFLSKFIDQWIKTVINFARWQTFWPNNAKREKVPKRISLLGKIGGRKKADPKVAEKRQQVPSYL